MGTEFGTAKKKVIEVYSDAWGGEEAALDRALEFYKAHLKMQAGIFSRTQRELEVVMEREMEYIDALLHRLETTKKQTS